MKVFKLKPYTSGFELVAIYDDYPIDKDDNCIYATRDELSLLNPEVIRDTNNLLQGRTLLF